MSAGNWISVPAGEKPIIGEMYRVRCNIRAPYTAANVALLKAQWSARLAGKGYAITSFKHAAPLYSAHGDGTTPWPFIVEMRAEDVPLEAGINPAGLIALGLTVVAIALAVNATEPKIERFVTETIRTIGDESRKGLKEILNPGVVLLAAVVLIFYFRAKGAAR